MRPFIACILCLSLGPGCCIAQKIGEEIGRAVGEALAQALILATPGLLDAPLTYAELEVLYVFGPRPEYLPWYAGAEIARFASTRLGLGPTSPPLLVQLLFQSLSDLGRATWDFLCWLNSVPQIDTD